MDFTQALNQLSPLTSNASEDLADCLKTKSFKKGDLLVKNLAVCDRLFFISEGLVKIFFYKEDKEFIMRFFREKTFCSVLDSFTSQKPSLYSIMALEDTQVIYITQKDIDLLCKKHHCMETGFRKLLSFAVAMMMKRVSEMLEENATERYNHFLAEHGHLLQRVSLGDLASYLGITQVSLSRIRGRK